MLGASRTSLAQARQRLSELSGAQELATLSADLFGVVDLLAGELPLRRTLADSSTPAEAKKALLDALLASRVSATTLAFLTDLTASRWSRPRDLLDALETLAVLASFEQALAEGALDDVEDELFRFSRLVERENALREALSDQDQPVEQRRTLLATLLADKANPISLRVIGAAITATGRHRTVPETLDAFAKLAAELRDRLNARVTSAVPLDEAQLERLGAGLSRLFGKTIGLRVELDPAIQGGLVIRVADQILDASVVRRLDVARRGLTA